MRRDVPIICAVEFLDSEGIRQKHKSVRFTIQIDDDGSGQKATERRAIEELGRWSEQALTDKVRSAVIDWATVTRLLRVVGTKTEAGLIVFDSSTNQPDSTALSVEREGHGESIGQPQGRALTLSEWVTSTRMALDGEAGEKPIGNSGKITLPVAGQLSDRSEASTYTATLHRPSPEWLIKNELLERVERECPIGVRLEFTRMFSDDVLKTVRDLKLAFDWVGAEVANLPDPPKPVETPPKADAGGKKEASKRGRPKDSAKNPKLDKQLSEAWKSNRYKKKTDVDDEFKLPYGTTYSAYERYRKKPK